MGSVAHFTDLRSGVVDALRLLAEATAGQSVIRVGAEACEVEWDPGARHHPALLLPLVLLTAAIDEGAARARWRGVGFAQAVGTAHRLDTLEKGMLLALADRDGAVDFAAELAAWIDRFGLDGAALEVDRGRLDGGDQYGVRPVRPMRDMPGVLKPLPAARRLAAVAVLALYNDTDAEAVFKGKRHVAMNPPAVEGFTALRREAGEASHAHLLRLIAAYRGW